MTPYPHEQPGAGPAASRHRAPASRSLPSAALLLAAAILAPADARPETTPTVAPAGAQTGAAAAAPAQPGAPATAAGAGPDAAKAADEAGKGTGGDAKAVANATAPAAAASAAKPNPGYYRDAGSYSTKPESIPPRYVRNASKTGIDLLKDVTWLDLGLDHRTRYEYRNDDFRRDRATTDNLFLFKTRAFVGIHDILDPLRFTIELQDSHAANGKFAKDNRDYNEAEPIQMLAELYFKDLLPKDPKGASRPISIRGGRFWLETLDRRLIANNQWRNTTNTFQGVHLRIGQDSNDWSLEALATQPLDRHLWDFDEPNEGQWFYGVIGHIRRWSDVITVEPYYLFLDQKAHGSRVHREVHATAVRFYGPLFSPQANYDVDLVYETGDDGGKDLSAFGAASEIGYTFDHAWKPRLSGFYGYASGDENPNDDSSQRFDRFYGFARPWSANDYFIWENFHAPKVGIEAAPSKSFRFDTHYNAYWLASQTDRWQNANLRDPTGTSGSFIGHEVDIRFLWQPTSRIDAVVGYAHFEPGQFTKNTGRSNASDFVYIEITINAFPRPA